MEKRSTETLQQYAVEHGAVTLRADAITKVLHGRPYKEISQYAQEMLIDLIVMATHGRGGLAHALLGSTADKVVHNAPCPVLTVRATEDDSASP